VKLSGRPKNVPYLRSILFAKEWKVPPSTPRHLGSSADALDIISFALRLVKVRRRIEAESTPASTRWSARNSITLVFPLPAPAITSTGPSVAVTASYWRSFSSSLMRSFMVRLGITGR